MWRVYRETDQFTDSTSTNSRYAGTANNNNTAGLRDPLSTTTNELSEPLIDEKPRTKWDRIVYAGKFLLRKLLDWGVLIIMLVIPAFTSSYVVVYAVPLVVGIILFIFNGIRYQYGWIKIFPKVFEVGMLLINLVLVIFEIVEAPSHDWNVQWSNVLTTSPLLALTIFSIIIDRPFTIEFAKEQVSESKWESPIFLSINLHVTCCWAVEFALSIIFSLLYIFAYPDASYMEETAPNIVILVLALLFTAHYPPWARARAIAELANQTRAFGDIL
jgi:hypothetical protein